MGTSILELLLFVGRDVPSRGLALNSIGEGLAITQNPAYNLN